MQRPQASGPFAETLDVRLADDGALVVDLAERHMRSGGIVHGGVLMSLLDMAMAAAVVRTLEAGERCVSVTINTDFLRPASGGRLVATARLERRGASMAFPAGEVRDAEGKVVARATGVWAIRPAAPPTSRGD